MPETLGLPPEERVAHWSGSGRFCMSVACAWTCSGAGDRCPRRRLADESVCRDLLHLKARIADSENSAWNCCQTMTSVPEGRIRKAEDDSL